MAAANSRTSRWLAREIRFHEARVPAGVIPLDSPEKLVSPALVPAGQDQIGPQPSQLHRDRPADPGSRPGNHARFTLQVVSSGINKITEIM